MRVSLVIPLAAAAILFQGGVGSAQSRPSYVDGAHFFVRPTFRIDLSGTGSWYIGNSRWLTWSSKGATARTTFYTNICKPNCAAGRLRSQPADVRFVDLVACRGSHVFSRFTITNPTGRLLLAGDFRTVGYLNGC